MKENTLKIKYKYCDDCGHVNKYEYNMASGENELAHNIAQSGMAFLCDCGWNMPMEDQLNVIEWALFKYGKKPSDYYKGKELMVTLKDPKIDVTVAIWDGEHFKGYKDDEVIAWAFLPARYDNTTIWY